MPCSPFCFHTATSVATCYLILWKTPRGCHFNFFDTLYFSFSLQILNKSMCILNLDEIISFTVDEIKTPAG